MINRIIFFIVSVQSFLHTELKKERFVQFINKFLGFTNLYYPEKFTGVAKIAYDFFQFENLMSRYIKYNGQRIVLEYVLNNVINEDYRESLITIEESERSDFLFLQNYGEPFDIDYLWNYEDDDGDKEPLYIGNYEEYEAETDFIVRVHQASITDDHKAYLRSIVNKFKIAGKIYQVKSLTE